MIHAKRYTGWSLMCAALETRRNRVDAYFVTFECRPDADYQHRYEWCCRFHGSTRKAFKMKDLQANKTRSINQRVSPSEHQPQRPPGAVPDIPPPPSPRVAGF